MSRRAAIAAAGVLAWMSGSADPARAQARQPRFELSAGGVYGTGYDLGQEDANLIANPGGGPYTLFESQTRADGGPGAEARIGFRLTPRLMIEGGALWLRPRLASRLTADLESAPDLTIREDLSRYIFDAALVATVGSFGGGRAMPFVRAGAGYLRDLHEGNVLVEEGQAYHVGGGVTLWLGGATSRRRLALRLDARAYILDGGIDLGAGTRVMGIGGGSLVYSF